MRHDGVVYAAQFSPDGQRIVTASEDSTARVWDAETGKEIGEPIRHEGQVYAAHFSPDGQRVVTASIDKTARVSELGLSRLTAAHFLEGLTTVVAAKGGLGVWNAQSGEDLNQIVPLPDEVTSLTHRLGSDWVVGETTANKTLRWNLKRPDQSPEISHILGEGFTSEIFLSPDGALLAHLERRESQLRVEILTADGQHAKVLAVPFGLKGKSARVAKMEQRHRRWVLLETGLSADLNSRSQVPRLA
jgi:WD40 repeat protein